jgi:hypothetical protein
MRRRHVTFQVHDRRADTRDTLLVVDDHPGLAVLRLGQPFQVTTVSAVWPASEAGCLREDCIGATLASWGRIAMGVLPLTCYG